MTLDLLPVGTFKGVLALAFYHGSMFKVFKMRRVQRFLEAGRKADAKALVEKLVRMSLQIIFWRDEETSLAIAAGELLAQLGGVDLAIDDYLLDAAQRLADGGSYLKAKHVVEAILTARPTHEDAKRQLSRIETQIPESTGQDP